MKNLIILIALILSSCSSMNNPVVASISSSKGYGQGVTVRSDGLILTAAHVLPDDDTIYISINNKNYTAKVVYRDDKKDFALVKVEDKNMPFAKISTNYNKGDVVKVAGFSGEIIYIYDDLYLDMKIKRGDSGSAVFNSKGEVVGVVTFSLLYSDELNNPSIGGALPSKDFTKVINLINK